MTRTDTDSDRLNMLTESRHTSPELHKLHKHKFETDLDSCTTHRLYTADKEYTCTLPTKSPWRAVAADVFMIAKQLLPQQPSHDNTMSKKHYLLNFRKIAQSELIKLIYRCKH